MLLDLLYPPKCPLCGTLIDPALPVCEACRGSLPHIKGVRCRICGRPVLDGEEICADCGEKEHSFDRGAGAFLYEGAFRESLGALKYRGEAEFGKRLGYLAAEELSEMIREWRPDRIVPVPLHKKRLRKRGYNQAARIADGISLFTGIPVDPKLLIRVRPTEALKGLGAAERNAELRSAFSLAGSRGEAASEPFSLGRILLADDIYTTGSTLDAAAGVLKVAGAEAVFFLTVCIGQGFRLA